MGAERRFIIHINYYIIKICFVNPVYLNYLRQFDSHVPKKNKRPYIRNSIQK